MRDHDPSNAAFDADDALSGADGVAPSVRDLEVGDNERGYSRPSLRYIDIHERPTLVP
jgi:hypothetical protein